MKIQWNPMKSYEIVGNPSEILGNARTPALAGGGGHGDQRAGHVHHRLQGGALWGGPVGETEVPIEP